MLSWPTPGMTALRNAPKVLFAKIQSILYVFCIHIEVLGKRAFRNDKVSNVLAPAGIKVTGGAIAVAQVCPSFIRIRIIIKNIVIIIINIMIIIIIDSDISINISAGFQQSCDGRRRP